MLYPIVLPEIKDLLTASFKVSARELNEIWAVDGYEPMELFMGGAHALAYICKQIAKPEESAKLDMLLPDYFCGQSLRFIRGLPVNLHFYPLNESLEPNYDFINELTSKVNIDLFLHVHYFGKVANQVKSRELCDLKGAKLIEDCAHIQHPSNTKNWFGDYLVFSPHKHFPVSNGGALFVKSSLKKDSGTRFNASTDFIWYMKRLINRVLTKQVSKNNTYDILMNGSTEALNDREPSVYESKLISHFSRSHLRDAEKIRTNHRVVANYLSGIENWKLCFSTDSGVPYYLAMRCDSRGVAEKRYLKLRENGVPVLLWPDLPSELAPRKRQAGLVYNRTAETIFFAVHQQIDVNEMLALLKKIEL